MSSLHRTVEGGMPPTEPSVGVGKADSLVAEDATLDRLLGMLEKVLVSNAQTTLNRQPKMIVKHNDQCKICQ